MPHALRTYNRSDRKLHRGELVGTAQLQRPSAFAASHTVHGAQPATGQIACGQAACDRRIFHRRPVPARQLAGTPTGRNPYPRSSAQTGERFDAAMLRVLGNCLHQPEALSAYFRSRRAGNPLAHRRQAGTALSTANGLHALFSRRQRVTRPLPRCWKNKS